jgi:hypothetical protein
MSFEKLSKKELVAVAEGFGVEASGTKADIITNLEAEGVTFELYTSLQGGGEVEAEKPVEAPAPAAKPAGDTLVLFKGKGSYSGHGAVWSAKNPFAVVTADAAKSLEARWPGVFRVATAEEAADYYG